MQKYEEELIQIVENNKDKRILVVGTTCTGKTTLINKLGIGEDMDKVIFPLLTQEEKDYVCQTPWTEEIGEKMDYLCRTKLKISPGVPMFATVILDADIIIYLYIPDEILKERTSLRNVDFNNAKNMQEKIEEELKKVNKDVIKLEITQ